MRRAAALYLALSLVPALQVLFGYLLRAAGR